MADAAATTGGSSSCPADGGSGGLGGASTDVKVVVRVRPQLLDMEAGVPACVEIDGHNSLVVRTPSEASAMQFNWVAGPATTQAEFFKVVGRPTVENTLSGFNCALLTYGQTGSGKTHTMIGDEAALSAPPHALPATAGLLPRMFAYLFKRMPEVQASMLASYGAGAAGPGESGSGDSSSSGYRPSLTWLVRCSMLEIHREEIYDLLRPGGGPLNLREDIRRGVYVEGSCERAVESAHEVLGVLRDGIRNRSTAATELNASSSRSHCIFICHVETRLEPQPGLVNVRSSRLHLVDLAGSERLRYGLGGMAAGAEGRLLKETTSINSSLTVLGLVILKLTEQQPHIPYRNSKLTFLLQDSLGRNAKTLIIANISPSEACLGETLSTLGFAARARKLVNKAVVNEDTNGDAELLRAENRRLKQELQLLQQGVLRQSRDLHSSLASSGGQLALSAAAQQLEEQQAQLQQALGLLAELGGRNTELQDALEYSKRERAELEASCLEGRQELAALQVSLQQTLKENKGWRHRLFKNADKKKSQSQTQQQQQQQQVQPLSPRAAVRSSVLSGGAAEPPYTAVAAGSSGGGSTSGSALGAAAALAGKMFGRSAARNAAAAAAASGRHGEDGAQLVQLQGKAMELLGAALRHTLQQLQHAPAGGSADGSSSSSSRSNSALEQLAALQQQVPQVAAAVTALHDLAAWQQQQQHTARASTPCAGAGEPALSPAPGSSAGRGTLVPVELHRQLLEERQLTAQLMSQVRQLQQQLLLASGAAGLSPGKAAGKASSSGSRAATQVGSDTNSSADAAATAARLPPAPADQEPAGTAEPAAAEPGTNGQVAALTQQVASLQEQLAVAVRQRQGLQGRLASARSVLAAARCSSSPSSGPLALPSRLSQLQPLFGESIDEEHSNSSPSAGASSTDSSGSSSSGGSSSARRPHAGSALLRGSRTRRRLQAALGGAAGSATLHSTSAGLLAVSAAAAAAHAAGGCAWRQQQGSSASSGSASASSSCSDATASNNSVTPALSSTPRAASAALATCAAAVAGASSEGEDDATSARAQQPQQLLQSALPGPSPPPGPAWNAQQYEEELHQLSHQLQELVGTNSSLKAALQQRDLAAAAQQARLEQQSHDLACCESMLEELQERLEATEAAAAASAAEHCDAMWAKGQVAGLLELNDDLQQQLEQRGQELEELKAALQLFMATEAGAVAAQAFAAAAAAQDGAGAAPASRHRRSSSGGSVASSSADSLGAELAAGTVSASKRAPGAAAVLDAASPGLQQEPHPASVARQLRQQTEQLTAQPHSAAVAAEQAVLLHHQLEAVGLQLQQKQLEAKLAQIKQQQDRLLQHQQLQHKREQQPYSTPQPQRHSAPGTGSGPARRPASTGARSRKRWQPRPSPLAQLAAAPAAGDAAQSEPPPQQVASEGGATTATTEHCASSSSKPPPPRCDASSSARQPASTPCSSTSRRRLPGAAAAGRSSSRCSDASSGGSGRSSGRSANSGSSGQCQDIIGDLLGQLHALASQSHETSCFRAASASTLAVPAGAASGPAAEWDAAGAAAELQARLQVSSAFELEAARGLLHAEAAVMELQSMLGHKQQGGTAVGASPPGRATGRRSGMTSAAGAAGTRETAAAAAAAAAAPAAAAPTSPPLARSLLSKFERADGKEAVAAVLPAPEQPAGGQQQQQERWLSIVQQLEEQQQRILQVLSAVPQPAKQLGSDCAGRDGGGADSTTAAADSTGGSAESLAGLAVVQQQLAVQLAEARAVVAQCKPARAVRQAEEPDAGRCSSSKHSPRGMPGRLSWQRASRDKQQSLLRASQETAQLQPHSHQLAPGSRSDQQQVRDSARKHARVQQQPQQDSDACDAGCQTDQPQAASGCDGATPGAAAHHHHQQQQQQEQQELQAAAEVVQLRGELAKLRLQLQQLSLRAQVAEQLRHQALQAAPASLSRASSRCASRAGDHDSGEAAEAAKAAAAGELPPLLPAGMLSPRRAAAAPDDDAAAAAAATTPAHASLLLTGQLRALQSRVVAQSCTIMQLEDQVRRQDMQLKQQALAAAGQARTAGALQPGGGSGSGGWQGGQSCTPSGSCTPRGGSGLFSPCTGAGGLFSPRRGAPGGGSNSASASLLLSPRQAAPSALVLPAGPPPSAASSPHGAAAGGSRSGSPTASGPTAAAAGMLLGAPLFRGWGGSPTKAATGRSPLGAAPAAGAAAAEAAGAWAAGGGLKAQQLLQQQQPSPRRLSLGGGGLKRGAAGGGGGSRLRLAALSKAHARRRQSMG